MMSANSDEDKDEKPDLRGKKGVDKQIYRISLVRDSGSRDAVRYYRLHPSHHLLNFETLWLHTQRLLPASSVPVIAVNPSTFLNTILSFSVSQHDESYHSLQCSLPPSFVVVFLTKKNHPSFH